MLHAGQPQLLRRLVRAESHQVDEESRRASASPAWQRYGPATLIVVLIGIGTVLRLIGITRQSLWLDEAFSTYLAAHRFNDILAFVASSDAHPPLYYLVLHAWLIVGQSALAMRMLSALASVGTVLVVYLLGRKLANRRVALVAAALMTFSAFQVWYAQEIRMYALTTLTVSVAMLAFADAWLHRRRSSWIAYTAVMLVAIYLDYTAFFVYTAVVAWSLRAGRTDTALRRPLVVSNVAVLVGYTPWLPPLVRQSFVFGNLTNWINGATGSGLIAAITDLFFNRSNLLQANVGPLALLAAIGSVVMVLVALWMPRHAPGYSLLAFWLGWPLALELVAELLNHPLVIARTLIVVQPALFLLLALSAEKVWMARSSGRLAWLRASVPVLLLILFLVTNVVALATTWNTTLKEDWRGAAIIVAHHAHPGDFVVFNAYFAQMPFDYYFQSDLRAHAAIQEGGYQTEESLLFANIAATTTDITSDANLAAYGRVWVVISHSGTTDNAAVPPWLAAHDQLVSEWRLVGITLRLYAVPDTGTGPSGNPSGGG